MERGDSIQITGNSLGTGALYRQQVIGWEREGAEYTQRVTGLGKKGAVYTQQVTG